MGLYRKGVVMKKILYMFFVSCFMCCAIAADKDFSSAINSTSMPTDSEIRAIISQFNFTKEQQEVIFKETKKKLQDMYSGKSTDESNGDLNKYMKLMEHESVNEYFDESITREVKKETSKLPVSNATNYSSMDLSTIPHDKKYDAAAAEKFRKYGPKDNWYKSGNSK